MKHPDKLINSIQNNIIDYTHSHDDDNFSDAHNAALFLEGIYWALIYSGYATEKEVNDLFKKLSEGYVEPPCVRVL